MLDNSSPWWLHVLQNLALLVLSIFMLPLDSLILVLTVIVCRLRRVVAIHNSPPILGKRTVLVTGVGMSKGLVLARLFAAAGFRVIGADFSPLACGRFSRSLASFHTLQSPAVTGNTSDYVHSLLSVIRHEQVVLWVSCSGVASAIEDGTAKEAVEATTNCRAVQYNVATTQLLHEKSSFIEHVAKLGLTIPETHTVTNRTQIHEVLSHSQKVGSQKYICKCVGVDDSSRGDMTLLPLASEQKTEAHVRQLNVTDRNPWIVQQYVNGTEYCTHALVVRGKVKAFVACPSSELLMHYVALAPASTLSQAMLSFTETIAHHGGRDFTGHLSFDFLVEGNDSSDSNDIVLYPIECNPRAHTAVALFSKTLRLVDAYESVLDHTSNPSEDSIVYPQFPEQFYWVGHDLVCSLALPCIALVMRQATLNAFWQQLSNFARRTMYWKDGTFDWDDPLPWWWLYHVYWPAQFVMAILRGQKWSRVNVSTTKMFTC